VLHRLPEPPHLLVEDPEVLVGDSSKLREALGWKPEIPLSTSLVDTLDWYRARG